MVEEEQKKESVEIQDKPEVKKKAIAKNPESKNNYKAHISKYKENVVKKIVKLLKEYPIIGAVNMEDMPASSLQSMRSQLRDQVVLLMAKRRVIKYAFEEIKAEKDLKSLVPHLKGMPALLFTKENPFKLFKVIKQNKSPAAAKAGQIAPKDIKISAGPTPFVPGPVIGELGAIGLKTEVKDGKIHIKEDAIVVKEGKEINAAAAGLLTRLGIEPMEIGLDLTAVYEKGIIYDKKVLDVDEEAFANDLNNAARWAFNLAVEAGHFTKETVNVLIPKAFRESKSVALEVGIMNDETKEEILAKAEMQAKSLKSEANIPDAPPKEEKKDDNKKEEVKPEDSKKEAIEDAKEEIKEELKEIEKEVQEEEKELVPDQKEVAEMKKEVNKVEEKLEKVEEKEKELPSTEKVIVDAIEKNKESEKPVVEKKAGTPERTIAPNKKKEGEESEKLFQELKQKGTLRDTGKEEPKVEGPKSPEDIIRDAHKTD